ncbi:peroxisomal biogenesis factor (PEX11), putative [Talaromyces stipitatus ATCC 10500]|uniref:Peroxisomal biogenesis factor (PEX11), putative n=1 Tax=Talaromyces stipitatus (strain ATCC 10500 / CBS 375.48 / QM 6759 / NRRL 1006) TaxID=441959 RepID=B8LY60_TALSN|nr:peroxisomal biogenesis factor (PEX11), putative [Talaromyces stipitatus ATCC 10500]EED23305.1 peroxisomal biogenesis factor (PEX11), putative [Talaromyces stipitatus ATCC 10500]
MVADALVYHPSVAHYLRFVATTLGRDKVLRTIQYFARFYSWYLFRTNNPTSAIAPWDALKKQFGLTRKILRAGKFVEHLKAASVAFDNKSASTDPVLKNLTVGRQLGYAGYLTLDSITLVDALGFKKFDSAKKLQEYSYRAWLSGLVCSVVAGVYTLYRLQEREKTIDRKEGEGVVEAKKIERERVAARIQLVSDLCDLSVPLSALGYVKLDDGLVGIAGTISSLIGVWSAWKKTA